MSNFKISTEKMTELKAKMEELGIREEDLQEQFVRSGGKGGQNVNKVASCVALHHIPTGIRVKCQEERSQGINRFKARWILIQKVEDYQKQQERRRIQEFQKQKRKARPRPQKIKEAILLKKRYHSQKKQERQKVRLEKLNHF